jgi:hypothetical protein
VSQEFTSELVMLARRPGSRSGGGVRVTGLALEKMPGAVRDEAQKAMIAVAMWWREKRAPAHFDVRAYDRYGNIEPNVYKKRTGPMGWMVTKGYTEPAQRMGGKVRPLVRTGKLRQMILHGSYTAQASGSGGSLKVRAWWPGLPRYTYMFDPGFVKYFGRHENIKTKPLVHNKVAELTIVDAAEVEEMRGVFDRNFNRLLKEREKQAGAA